jgi:polar amino acid transport system substrate-binding protein
MDNARRVLLLVTLIGMLTGGANRAAAEERPLIWAADTGGGEPYVFENPEKNGAVLGFEADLRDALARELGRPITFKQYEFSQLEQGLDRRDFDFAMNGLEITASRREKVLFTRPYYVYRLGLVVRAGDDRFKSLDDVQKLSGATIGTLDGSYAQELLGKRFDTKAIDALSAQDQIYENLVNKRTDAVYLDTIINATYLEKEKFRGLRPVGDPGDKGYYGIAVRMDNQALRQQLDEALGRIIASGELRRIYNKWYIWNYDQYELGQAAAVDTGAADEWRVSNYLPLLAAAAWMTVKLSVVSFAIAVVVGLIIALMRLYGPAWMRAAAVSYVEFFRGIPVLFLVLFLYFALPGVFRAVGLEEWGKLEAFYVAVIALGLNYAAYEAEIYRAGIGSVPAGQWEAAKSLGMSGPLAFRRIILPQAVKFILPPMTGDFVALFKDTSVVSFIGVVELSNQFQRVAKNSLNYLEVGLITAVLYLIMSVPLGYLSRYLEKRWGEATV